MHVALLLYIGSINSLGNSRFIIGGFILLCVLSVFCLCLCLCLCFLSDNSFKKLNDLLNVPIFEVSDDVLLVLVLLLVLLLLLSLGILLSVDFINNGVICFSLLFSIF